MGMTDKQFNAHLRSLIAQLDMALQAKDWNLVAKLREQLQKDLED